MIISELTPIHPPTARQRGIRNTQGGGSCFASKLLLSMRLFSAILGCVTWHVSMCCDVLYLLL